MNAVRKTERSQIQCMSAVKALGCALLFRFSFDVISINDKVLDDGKLWWIWKLSGQVVILRATGKSSDTTI